MLPDWWWGDRSEFDLNLGLKLLKVMRQNLQNGSRTDYPMDL
jgi:hypothetical protein